MRVVYNRTGKAIREQYAKMLEQVANDLRNSDKVPDAMFIQIVNEDGSMTKAKLIEADANVLAAIGAFYSFLSSLTQCVLEEAGA